MKRKTTDPSFQRMPGNLEVKKSVFESRFYHLHPDGLQHENTIDKGSPNSLQQIGSCQSEKNVIGQEQSTKGGHEIKSVGDFLAS